MHMFRVCERTGKAIERRMGRPSQFVDLSALAKVPAWPLARILALPGRCRGGLMTDWAEHVGRRYGDAEPDRMRAALGLTRVELPDQPEKEGWYPVGYQLGLTRVLVDSHLGGDILKLEALIHEDARRKQQGVGAKVARWLLTPRRLMGAAEKVYPHVYDIGAVDADVQKHLATFRWSGAAFMEEPIWRVLQVFAVRGLFDALGEPQPEIRAAEPDGDRFEVVVRY